MRSAIVVFAAVFFGATVGFLLPAAGLPEEGALQAWVQGDPCELRVEAQAIASADPLTAHFYWTTPTGQELYGLIQAKIEGDQIALSLWWPTKPGTPWKARLDWKGGPLEGLSTHWFSCP
jgi:hypothetical protein